MRPNLYRVLCAVALWSCALCAGATTVTGTIKVNGTPFNGSMVVQLNFPGSTGTYINLPAPSAKIPIQNGTFADLALDGNDSMLPRQSYYSITFYNPNGTAISRSAYFISGATFDLGAAVPTPVLTNNVNFLDLLGIRNFSAQNASFSSSITIGSGTSISAGGVSNAKSIMGVVYADAYHQQNPSSLTCGVQEALSAIPNGGIVVLQPGACNLLATISISKSNTIIQGQGLSSLVQTGSIPAISVAPASGSSIANITLRDFYVSGSPTATSVVSLGLSSSPSSFVREVVLDNVWAYGAPSGSSVSVTGSLDGLLIYNSRLFSSQKGLYLHPAAGCSVGRVSLGPALGIYSNSGDGIDVSAPGTISDISSRDLRVYSNGGNGVNIEFGVTTAFSTIQSTFSGNSNAGLFLAGGTGHSVYSSFFSGSVYGINVSSLGATNSQTLSVSNSSFSSNSTNDLFVGTAVPYVLWYPQISQTATVSDTGGKVHRFTVTP